MKKTISYIMIICVFISLSGCVWDPASYLFDYEKLKEQVATVELINYENEEPKKIKDISEILPYDFDKEEVLETLPADKIDDFIMDLSEIRFMIDSDFSNSPVGICIKITYKNGEFIIISVTLMNGVVYCFIEVFDKLGYSIEHIGGIENRDDIDRIINKYFYLKTNN
mgnify:FL=1